MVRPRPIAVLLLALAWTTALRAIEPFEATYRLLYNGEPKGETRFSLHLESGDYRFRAVTRPLGDALDHQVLEASQGRLDGARPRPATYYYAVKERGRTRMVELIFDWGRAQLKVRDERGQENYALEPGAQDRLSYLLQAMALTEGPESEARFLRVGPMGAERLVLEKKREGFLDTPAGRFPTREILIRSGDGGSVRHLWLAANGNPLPLLLEQHQDDALVRMELVRIHR